MATDTGKTELENGLRLLARMIARAYLRDTRSEQTQPDCSEEKDKEEENGD